MQLPINFKLPGGDVQLIPELAAANEALRWREELENTLTWQQHSIALFGREVDCPRLSAWHGDKDALYGYSGIPLEPEPWTPLLQSIRERCERATDTKMNSVLVNWYRDGKDSMGWHSDDEPELGPKPVILSLSLGEPRYFHLRHKNTGKRLKIMLPSGSLLVMGGNTQRYWQHAINKSKREMESRINLTFRNVTPAAS